MVVNDSKIVPKSSKKFVCVCCDYSTSRKSQYNRHLLTAKHLNNVNDSKRIVKKFQEVPNKKSFVCGCGKEYRYDSGFYRHKRSCTYTKEPEDKHNKDLINYLIKENNDLKKMLIENNGHNTTNINSNNKNVFNIQVFLNEDCKDAMNMSEFIESIQVSIEDIKNIGLEGQTEGMSKLFINKLQGLDIVKRPVHCSDLKNETIFVKDHDKWEEEAKNNPKLKEALDKITVKTMDKLPEISQDPEEYMKTVSEVSRDPRDDKEIIKKIAKEVCVES